jgi:hypothetical protein
MIKKTLYVMSVFTSLALVMSGCCGIETTPAPTSVPEEKTTTPTLVPETVTVDIDPGGGQIESPDGRVALIFPPLATDETLSVSLAIRGKSPEDGGVLSPIIEITTSPEMEQPLNVAAVLKLLEPPADAPASRYARLMTLPGEIRSVEGEGAETITYWLPLEHTRPDEDGLPSLPLAQFSTYALLSPQMTESMERLQSEIDALGARMGDTVPEGYEPAGEFVTIDRVYFPALSTAPPTRPGSPLDLVDVLFGTVEVNGIEYPLMLARVFVPAPGGPPQSLTDFEPSPEVLEPPQVPYGSVYVGREVVIDGERDQDLSTIPADRQGSPGVLSYTNSRTVIANETAQRAITVTHWFGYDEQGEIPPECADFDTTILEQPDGPGDRYEYKGRVVTVDSHYNAEYSTIPQGQLPFPSKLGQDSAFRKTKDGKVVCEITAHHVFAPITGGDGVDCRLDRKEQALPTVLDDYAYVGRTVSIDGTLVESDSFVDFPFDAPDADGMSIFDDYGIVDRRTYEYVKEGTTECNVTEEHLYSPVNLSGCPTPPALLESKHRLQGFKLVGTDVAVNHHLAQSTIPQGRPLGSTDTVVVDSETTGNCSVSAAHTYERGHCLRKLVIKSQVPPEVEKDGTAKIWFPPEASLSLDDAISLVNLSPGTAAYRSGDGTWAFMMIGSAEVTYDEETHQVTITVPECPEE